MILESSTVHDLTLHKLMLCIEQPCDGFCPLHKVMAFAQHPHPHAGGFELLEPPLHSPIEVFHNWHELIIDEWNAIDEGWGLERAVVSARQNSHLSRIVSVRACRGAHARQSI